MTRAELIAALLDIGTDNTPVQVAVTMAEGHWRIINLESVTATNRPGIAGLRDGTIHLTTEQLAGVLR